MSSHTAKRPRLSERTMQACVGCKQKKLKCDGQSPKCQNCMRTERDCLVEDPATGLHRPRNYMQSLETRVAYLESLLQQARPDVALDHYQSENDAADSPRNVTVGRRREEDDLAEGQLDNLPSEVALLCINAAGREPQYFGASSAVSFSRIAGVTMGLSKKGASSIQSEDIVTGLAKSPKASARFPTPTRAKALSDAYFNNIAPQYPFLHRPTFEVWEDACIQASLSGHVEAAGDTAVFFVFMVYAIGCLAIGPRETDTAEGYYSFALDHQASILDLDNLQSIQSILCCAVYSVRSPFGASLWKLSGQAIRHCVELGYHRNTTNFRSHLDVLTAELSKRCFWVAYDLDRVAAFILGRPVGISDDSIDAELPLDVDDCNLTSTGLSANPRTSKDDPPTRMTGFRHAIKLRSLWSKIIDSVYNPTKSSAPLSLRRPIIEELRHQLDEWHITVPALPEPSGTCPLSVFASKEWFQLAYNHTSLILYRPYLTPTTSLALEDEVAYDKAIEECFDRAREVCLLYRRLYQSPTIQFTWGSLHILFLGGLTYLYCLWRSERVRQRARQSDVVSTCMACTTVLVIIAERWNQARTYRDTFETLSNSTIAMICGDTQRFGPALAPNAPNALNEQGDGITMNHHDGLWDCAVSFDQMLVPQESEWLVEELLQGMREFQPQDAMCSPLDGIPNSTGQRSDGIYLGFDMPDS